MGVDIATYRKRIGSIHHGKESDVSTVQFSVNGNDVLGTLGAVAFIGILLVISGIEQNPGPGLKEVAASVALVGIFISILKGLDISWKTYVPVLLLVMIACYLVSQSKQWKRYFRRNEDNRVEKDTTKTKVQPEAIEVTNDVYKCEICDGKSIANNYCSECEEYMSDDCADSHKKQKATETHEILSAEIGPGQKKNEEKKDIPGKPHARQVFPDSILLIWDPPTNFSDKSCYQISFKDMSSNQRWRSYHEDIQSDSTKITGLKSNATYVFRIRVIYENGEESPFSLESEEIRTAASLATKMLERSKPMTCGDNSAHRYALPITENIDARNEKAKTRKFEVGTRPSRYVESKTIMLLGATGTGKSTFVDGIVNYVLGVTWEDPFRYTIINLEAEEEGRIQNQAFSQTEWITCYTINPESGSRLSYQLNIIDTPGFGDTRGIERDKKSS